LADDLIRRQGFDGAGAACASARAMIRKNTPGVSPVQLTKSSLFWVLKSANLAIEIPDFHITPAHKLPSGLRGPGVCLGLDGFVRRYAMVSID
jgi:hypothetical protein